MVNTNYHASYNLTITANTISFCIRLIDSVFDSITGDDFTILLEVVIT